MAVNTQFSIAVHIMAGLGHKCGQDITSTKLASSVNTSPSFVRRILAKLSKAGLIDTAQGKAGACWLAKNPSRISLLDIYQAVDSPKAFAIHKYPEKKPCLVSCHIKTSLEKVLNKTQKSLEGTLDKISLASILSDMPHE